MDENGANLSITPVGPVEWTVELVRGQKEPHLQGGYSPKTTEWEPNTCAEYHGRIEDDTVFAWIIIPTHDGPACPVRNADLKVIDGVAILSIFHANQ